MRNFRVLFTLFTVLIIQLLVLACFLFHSIPAQAPLRPHAKVNKTKLMRSLETAKTTGGIVQNNNFILHVSESNVFVTKEEKIHVPKYHFVGAIGSCDIGYATSPGIVPIGPYGSYRVNTTNPYGLSDLEVKQAISSGFSTWIGGAECNASTQTGYTLSSTEAKTDDYMSLNGYNELYFMEIGDESILALTILWIDSGVVVEGDIIINSRLPAPISIGIGVQSNKFDLKSIILHEIGHFLGLGHTSPNFLCSSAIMYPYLAPAFEKPSLTAFDIKAIKDLFFDNGYCYGLVSSGAILSIDFALSIGVVLLVRQLIK